jgi:uncharacterized protein (DUF1697 family)
MPAYIALLRAVNLMNTVRLSMADLKQLCEKAGCANVRTYIASGNVVFTSTKREAAVKAALESALERHAGRPIPVMVRTAAEMAEVLARNPFPHMPANKTLAIFLDAPPASDTLKTVAARKDEEIRLGKREVYVFYPNGQGQSRLRIPAASSGTGRNLNTVAKLAEMAAKLEDLTPP